MPITAPKLDHRTALDVVRETEALIEQYTSINIDKERMDVGQALVHIFGLYSELIIERLNQVPEKNFLAFLDLIGTQIQPPQPARVPLTFSLAKGSPDAVVIPANMRVAAPPSESEQDEIVFETETELVTTKAQLKAIWVHEPSADQCSNQSKAVLQDEAHHFAAFVGNDDIEHALYIAQDDLFTLPNAKSVVVTFLSDEPDSWRYLPLVWEYWDGEEWQALNVSDPRMNGREVSFTLNDFVQVIPCEVDGQLAAWIRVALGVAMPHGKLSVDGSSVTRRDLTPDALAVGESILSSKQDFYPFGSKSSLLPFYIRLDEAFVRSGAQVTFYPSLAQDGSASSDLELNWSFWNGGGWQVTEVSDNTRAFSQNGTITMYVPPMALSNRFTDNLPEGYWLKVEVAKGNYGGESDAVLPILRKISADYTWTLPHLSDIDVALTIEQKDLQPELAFHNRVPLDISKPFLPFGEQPRRGDAFYLAHSEIFSKSGAELTVTVEMLKELSSDLSEDVNLAWEIWSGETWESIAVVTDKTVGLTKSGTITFTLPGQTSQWRVNGKANYWLRVLLQQGIYGREAQYIPQDVTIGEHDITFHLLIPAIYDPPHVKHIAISYTYTTNRRPSYCKRCNDFSYVDWDVEKSDFTPFVPPLDAQPTLYLGFDRPFANRPNTLYLQAIPPRFSSDLVADNGVPPMVQWEYATDAGWKRLSVADTTENLTERGLIAFVGPSDFVEQTAFCETCYWLRARWISGSYRSLPRLGRILTNTTWARQAITIRDELLGSGNGEPNQQFRTAQVPVLISPLVEVRELQRLSTEEPTDQTSALDYETAGHAATLWVCWLEVADFHSSTSHDRHYILDHLTGDIVFGDGRRGMIPPVGQNNIRASRYLSGGGERGNLAANTITQLKVALPFVDSVINREQATGGSDQESLQQVKTRGPRQLRHRDRAVTGQDFEDMAYAASADVARAKAIIAHGDQEAGQVVLIVVPDSNAIQPIPSLGLLDRVENYILQRCVPTLDLWVVGPEWNEVSVVATIAPLSLDSADSLADEVMAALQQFLHPLAGGTDRTGWAFGRKPYKSDLYALLEGLPGVDHVRSLEFNESVDMSTIPPERRDRYLVFPGPSTITLTAPTLE